ncbi:hypothetical protein PMZ80_003669 [Knufia obscura]|uniref:Uncharacterized protein n=2 Tax=Knufia TaxID=430999 RepID=A0AAN8ETB2_9EURO|nr:hypothetical protein PMZ80_003669 [Knufia obscura]KAK5958418.1 hypothetical protein OHC33_000261 [Knufia fluminis]
MPINANTTTIDTSSGSSLEEFEDIEAIFRASTTKTVAEVVSTPQELPSHPPSSKVVHKAAAVIETIDLCSSEVEEEEAPKTTVAIPKKSRTLWLEYDEFFDV